MFAKILKDYCIPKGKLVNTIQPASLLQFAGIRFSMIVIYITLNYNIMKKCDCQICKCNESCACDCCDC